MINYREECSEFCPLNRPEHSGVPCVGLRVKKVCDRKGNYSQQTITHSYAAAHIPLIVDVSEDELPANESPTNNDIELSLVDKGKNLFKAGSRFVLNRGRILTGEEQTVRLDVCAGCDRNKDGTCMECGCNLFAKTSLSTESCPIGKWATATPSREKSNCNSCGKKNTSS